MIVDQVFDSSKHSKVLRAAKPVRVPFNPRNKKHRESAKKFLQTGSWGDVLFVAELPHIEVPATVLSKLAAHALGIHK